MKNLPPSVVAALADPVMRMSHLLWHGLRDQWLGLDTTTRSTFIQQFGVKWVPVRPSRDRFGNLKFDNNAGLDFLYMHREMICMVNCLLEKAGAGPIEGWKAPPRAVSPEFPPALDYRLPPSIYRSKDNPFWEGTVLASANQLLSADTLSNIPLAKLGTLIEYTIHSAMHERFGGYATSGDLRPGIADLLTSPGTRYNKIEYDTLLDSYAAHVHPWFWSIHGWIDTQITQWEKYNDPVQWDAWMGPMSHCKMNDGDGHDGSDGEVQIEDLTKALTVIAGAGMDGFFRARQSDFDQIAGGSHLIMMERADFGEPKPDRPGGIVGAPALTSTSGMTMEPRRRGPART